MVKQIPHLFVLLLMLNLSMYSFTGNCPNKRISILILTDSVIIHIRHIFTILDIKSKYYKWNVVKRSTRKDREEKRGRKKPDNFFQMKEENENISFKYKYNDTNIKKIFLNFLQIFFPLILACSRFCVCILYFKLSNILCRIY